MIQIRNTVILLALLLVSIFAEKDPEPIFKALGEELEMGYCFGDDIAVYRMTADGKKLLGQFSNPSVSPPDAYKDRLSFSTEVEGLLGLKLTNLQFSDSGIYIKECWSDSTMDNYRKHYLYVCDKEFSFKEISLTPGTGADLECSMDSIKHATVKWYRDVHNVSLFMDTKISLEPLQAEFKSLIQVHFEGSFLHVSDQFIEDRPRFFCQVMEGEHCRSFQTIGLPEEPDLKTVYRSYGEDVVLKCSVDPLRQNHWKTPFGQFNSSAPEETTENQMGVSTNSDSKNYSLLIQSVSPDHSGSYKCFSTFLVEDYYLNVCTLHESTDISFSAYDKKVVLQCNFMSSPAISDKIESACVLWYRKTGEKDIKIMDPGDPSFTPPGDLQGRVKLSQDDSALIFTDPRKEDSGMYWCVLLLENEETDEGDDEDVFSDDYDSNEDEEEETHSWIMDEEYMDVCLFRQVTNLKFHHQPRKFVHTDQFLPGPEPEPASEPEHETNLMMYALCAGLVGLLLLAVICIVVVLKIRAKKRSVSTQGKGLKPSEEIALNEVNRV